MSSPAGRSRCAQCLRRQLSSCDRRRRSCDIWARARDDSSLNHHPALAFLFDYGSDCGCEVWPLGRSRRSAMNWSNSALSLAKRSRFRNSLNSRCSSSSRRSVSARCSSKARLPLERGVVPHQSRSRSPPVNATETAIHLVLPSAHAIMVPTTHSSTPDHEGEDGEAQRPPPDKAENHQRDPGWFSELIDPCCN